MHRRLEAWFDWIGRHIMAHGWSDPWVTIPPMQPDAPDGLPEVFTSSPSQSNGAST